MTPVDENAAVPPIAVQLGVALMELGGSTVAYLDANTRYPALTPTGSGDDPDGTGAFSTHWLFESLALLTPKKHARAVDAVAQLEQALSEGAQLFEYVLVDLTGFEQLGELEEALDLVEHLILVVSAGRSRERDLIDFQLRLADQPILGTLLVE
jgi:hypothetical protein